MNKQAALCKYFLTGAIHVKPLARVQSFMNKQLASCKVSPTNGTLVGFFTRMQFFMSHRWVFLDKDGLRDATSLCNLS